MPSCLAEMHTLALFLKLMGSEGKPSQSIQLSGEKSSFSPVVDENTEAGTSG